MSWLGRIFGRRPAQARTDGWANVITGLGTARDKRRGVLLRRDCVSDDEARELWLSDWLAKRIIELLPRTATRRGFTVKIDENVDQAEKIDAYVRRAQIKAKFTHAMMARRAYGGSALLPILDGSLGALATPLTPDMLPRISSFRAMHLLEPRELLPVEWYSDLRHPKFGLPSTYVFVPLLSGGTPSLVQTIHESRLVIFQGVKVTRQPQTGNRYGWGDSVLSPVKEKIQDYGQDWSGVSALLKDFSQAVLSIDGLGALVGNDQDETARNRIAQIDLLRSLLRMTVIDTKDKFERVPTPLAGLAEILREMAVTVAAAADTPLTVLFGTSPAGLNATGESDITLWDDRAGAEQEDVTPQLEQVHRLVMAAKDGPTGGEEPKNWSLAWHPLRTPTAKEDAETRWLIAQADDKNINNQVYTAEEAANSHYGGDTFRPDIVLDKAARAAMKRMDPTGNPAAPPAPDPVAPPANEDMRQIDERPPVAKVNGVRRSAIKMPAPSES